MELQFTLGGNVQLVWQNLCDYNAESHGRVNDSSQPSREPTRGSAPSALELGRELQGFPTKERTYVGNCHYWIRWVLAY